MNRALHPGDCVRHDDGREGIIDGIYAEAVALVRWDEPAVSYESTERLSKVKSERADPTCASPVRKTAKRKMPDEEGWSSLVRSGRA
jgi:hypothetical protein